MSTLKKRSLSAAIFPSLAALAAWSALAAPPAGLPTSVARPQAPAQRPPTATGPSARYVDGRVLPLAQGSNFRDIGGYLTVDGRHVKWGLLFRSGGTPLLTEDDLETVRSLGLKHMVDLRSSEERSLAPSRIEGVEYNAMGYSIAAMVAAARRDPAAAPDPGAAYRMFPSSLGPQLRMIVKLLLADEAPLVYNCSAGQDRTGFVTAMLLSALGVPRDTILEDYHLSTRYRHPRYEMPAIDVAAHPGNAAALIWGSYQKDPGYDTPRPLRAPDGTSLLAYSFAEIERRWGTVDRYLAEEAGVSTLDIIRLRSLYLE